MNGNLTVFFYFLSQFLPISFPPKFLLHHFKFLPPGTIKCYFQFLPGSYNLHISSSPVSFQFSESFFTDLSHFMCLAKQEGTLIFTWNCKELDRTGTGRTRRGTGWMIYEGLDKELGINLKQVRNLEETGEKILDEINCESSGKQLVRKLEDVEETVKELTRN